MKVHSANQTINSIDRVSTFFSQYYVPLQTLDKGMRDLMPLVREIYDFYNQKYSYLLFGRDLGVSTELFDGADSLRASKKIYDRFHWSIPNLRRRIVNYSSKKVKKLNI
eukprot:GHVP01049273.1.p1 GENE.GHVP01049273.1~~GHVP01049273.1.p1  ORF type:complete len:109 (-),score=6.41 GHVP01049273.1:187-513(-)